MTNPHASQQTKTPRRVDVCTYCNRELPREKRRRKDTPESRNDEHCVGRQLFGDPPPEDLSKIVVPSCRKCNGGFTKDEDYFAAAFLVNDFPLSEVGERIRQKAMTRGFPKNDGLRAAMRIRMTEVGVRTPGGLQISRVSATLTWYRISHVLGKWARGLYLKEYGACLAPDTGVDVAQSPPPILTARHFGPAKPGMMGWPGIFEYWHSRDEVQPALSRWSFILWDAHRFVVATNHLLEGVEELQAVGSTSIPLGSQIITRSDLLQRSDRRRPMPLGLRQRKTRE